MMTQATQSQNARTLWRLILLAAVAALLVCIGILSTAGSACASDENPWSGQWDSHWRNGRARLVLTQDGRTVSGVYFPRDGVIEGVVEDTDGGEGRILRGRFREDGRDGEFTFSLGPNGESFMGRFDSGEWWNGGRLSASTNLQPWQAQLESPRAAMGSFLTAFNEIRYGGLDFVDAGLASVDFQEQAGAAPLTPTEKFRRASLLFEVVDACMLHLWDLPDAAHAPTEPAPSLATDGPNEAGEPSTPPGERPVTHTYTLQQVGTPIKYEQLFLRDAAGNWRLTAPPNDELLALRTQLRTARGTLQPDPHGHLALPHPRGALRTFIEQVKHWDEGGSDYVINTMDLSDVDPEMRDTEAPLLAEYLKQVLDRAGFLIWQELPNDPSSNEPYVHFEHPLGRVVVAPMRDPENPEAPAVWRFTPETLRTVRALYDAFEDLPVAEGLIKEDSRSLYFRLRSKFRKLSPTWVRPIGPIERWQALVVLVLVFGAFVAAGFIARLPTSLAWVMRKRDDDTRKNRRRLERRYAFPLGLLVAGVALHELFELIGVPPNVLWALGSCSLLTAVVGGTWLLFSGLDDLGAALQARSYLDDSSVDSILVSLLTSTAKIGIVVVGLFLAADILHIPYRTVFAGLGIGGLAFAIAAQDTLANFFGSAVLLADRPFLRGDLVSVHGQAGHVEHVGLRSTQIRTFDDSVVVIPNRVLAGEVIDNQGRSRMRVLRGTVGATYDTTPEVLDSFVIALRVMLQERSAHDDALVYAGVSEFADSSINVKFRASFNARNYGHEVQVRHAILLDVARLAQAQGVEFAFPTQTVHIEESSGAAEVSDSGDGA